MKLDLNKDDVWTIRYLLDRGTTAMEGTTTSESGRNMGKVGRKVIRKLNQMLVKIEGHDCRGYLYLGQDKNE
jgi:hypothetical protein